jgi:hypothetical protein
MVRAIGIHKRSETYRVAGKLVSQEQSCLEDSTELISYNNYRKRELLMCVCVCVCVCAARRMPCV